MPPSVPARRPVRVRKPQTENECVHGWVLPRARATANAPYAGVVERLRRQAAQRRAPGDRRADNPAIRDAAEIVARAAADEAAADRARGEYLTRSMPALAPDDRIAPLLGADEHLLAVRRSAVLDRRRPPPRASSPESLAGDLYVTSRRIVLLGRLTLAIGLDEIEDAVVAGERILLAMGGGKGAALDVARPRQLRVEIATARAFARS
jgi:hypothetical protein